jgi:hypothetical protein
MESRSRASTDLKLSCDLGSDRRTNSQPWPKPGPEPGPWPTPGLGGTHMWVGWGSPHSVNLYFGVWLRVQGLTCSFGRPAIWAQIAVRIFIPDPSPDLNPDPYCYCVQYTCTLRKSVHKNMPLLIGNEVIKILSLFSCFRYKRPTTGNGLHEF